MIFFDGTGHPLICLCGKPATSTYMYSTAANSPTGLAVTVSCGEHPSPVPGEFCQPQHEAPAARTASVTRDTALVNAVRLLDAAELEIDLAKMERYEHLADSWINIAGMLGEQEFA